ncbi:MAG: putative toxin-antitoxin system toxin component, PIN family [Thermomicrobiales bacterium]|nr:putative toxin-antitoxin system toxin component, PIN family [Thermomicrobiales bacterium]
MSERPVRVVFDTNVIVSGWISPHGPCRTLLTLARNGELDLALSHPVIDEYLRVLSRPRLIALHGVDAKRIRTLLEDIARHSTMVTPATIGPVIAADPTDDVFLACAIGAGAGFVVSGDRHLLELRDFSGTVVLRPHEMLAALELGEIN